MNLLQIQKDNNTLGIIHFIGIGGMCISAIAEIMWNLGYVVQGSDASQSVNTQRLSNLGINIFYNHRGSNVKGVEYVVASTAIKSDNPEIIFAKENNIPIVTRAEMMSEIMKMKTSISISGSHGKTTTTSMIAHIFETMKLEPSVIAGGILNNKATNAYHGDGKYIIAEADESDGTFIKVPSSIAVITNIDPEHLDFYKTFDNLKNAFRSFIQNIPFYGFAVACIDNAVVRDIVNSIKNRRIYTYTVDASKKANIMAINMRLEKNHSTFDIQMLGDKGVKVFQNLLLPVPGIHNIQNSLAAISVGVNLGIDINDIKKCFLSFQGVQRRFTNVGDICFGKQFSVRVIDDYAHHPEEIISTLKVAQNYVLKSQDSTAQKSKGRIIAIFQPHRYSRLKLLLQDFVKSLDIADYVCVTPIYSAGEQKDDTISSAILVQNINDISPNKAFEYNSVNDVILGISPPHGCDNNNIVLQPNDIIIFMGAGDITKWAYSYYEFYMSRVYS